MYTSTFSSPYLATASSSVMPGTRKKRGGRFHAQRGSISRSEGARSEGVDFTLTDCAVLERREHRGGHVGVVHQLGGTLEQAPRQQNARLDRHGGQLLPLVQHVADGVDVGDVCLLRRRLQLAAPARVEQTRQGGEFAVREGNSPANSPSRREIYRKGGDFTVR
eukprot:1195956-Prorocentrum_minimum.AAC.4